jgi:hypothetical protein
MRKSTRPVIEVASIRFCGASFVAVPHLIQMNQNVKKEGKNGVQNLDGPVNCKLQLTKRKSLSD